MADYKTILCEDCAGRGYDPGSLSQLEECPSCMGSGNLIHPEDVALRAKRFLERMPMQRARNMELDKACDAIQELEDRRGFGS